MTESTNYVIGKIYSISDPQTFGEKTEVIDVILETGAKYKSYPAVQFKNALMKKVEGFQEGQTVCIGFKLDGYNHQESGRNYTKAVGLSMFKLEEAPAQGKSMAPETEIPRGEGADEFLGNTAPAEYDNSGIAEDDLPF